eukprot:CAMPEP_0117451342 /NCGR_PEP_ID=MMETSP0759-20121206/8956_1 /TAXON_ID=63605 /ORGANISM="Percolomonas cosmopolitus, Strain WS" /LENGTH=539 /DNA_ID=CAMNT_0005243935 /DNA_START=173 /DNA_END=1789 /DNA_ORIENTATION=-
MGNESSSIFGARTDELDDIIEKIQQEAQCPNAKRDRKGNLLGRKVAKGGDLPSADHKNHDKLASGVSQMCPETGKLFITKELIAPDSLLLPQTNELKIKVRPLYNNMNQDQQLQQQYLGLYDNSSFVDELNRIRYEKLDSCWKTKVELKTFWGLHMTEVLKHNSWNDQWVALQIKREIEEARALEEESQIDAEEKDEESPANSEQTLQLTSNTQKKSSSSTNPLNILKRLAGTLNAQKKKYTSSYHFGVTYDFKYGEEKELDPVILDQNQKPSSDIFHHLERDEFDLIHLDLMRLVSNYCETVQVYMQAPFADKELKASVDPETGVVTKRMPSIQKFFVQIFDGTSGMEFCRYSIHVNCYSTDPCLIGMLYRKHGSTNWHYRATNTFKTQMPKTLMVHIHEAADLISCDDNGLSDPYVNLKTLGDQKVKSTEVLKRTLQPKWNVIFPCLIQQNLKNDDALVEMQMFGADSDNHQHCLMGELTLTLAEIFCCTNTQFTFSETQGPQLNCKKWWPLDMSNVPNEFKTEQKNRDRKPKILIE